MTISIMIFQAIWTKKKAYILSCHNCK